jgi:hypothetical protein
MKSLWKPATNWTSPVTPPDKSSEGLWNPVERFWNSVSNRTSLTDRTNPVPPPDKSSGLSGVWSKVYAIQWIHRTSAVKPDNRSFGRLSTSTSHRTFVMCLS